MNNLKEQKYLSEIDFSKLLLWDVKRLFLTKISSKYDVVFLTDVISERSEKIKLFDFPEENFGILGVNNKIGLFDAYKEFGKNINQSYKKVKNGDLAYNPYRINVGSIGLKTDGQENNFISPAYVVFALNQEKVSSEFLYILFKTNIFTNIINENTTGSVRQNLKYSTLSQIQIPLPSLSEQGKIVEKYNKKIKKVKEADEKSVELEKNIEEYLMEELGIEKTEKQEKKKGLQEVNFKDLERWDFRVKDIDTLNILNNSKYSLFSIGDIYYFPKRSWDKKDREDKTFKYIELGAIDQIKGILFAKDVFVKDAPSRATQKVKTNDLVIGTTRPYLKRFAIVSKNFNENICSSGFSIIEEKKEEYNLNFLKEFLFSYIGIEQIKNKMTGALYPAITVSELKNIKIPLPPLLTQEKIVEKISGMKDEIKELKKLAEGNRKNAILEFESEIFSK